MLDRQKHEAILQRERKSGGTKGCFITQVQKSFNNFGLTTLGTFNELCTSISRPTSYPFGSLYPTTTYV